jgi:hypothetical protein
VEQKIRRGFSFGSFAVGCTLSGEVRDGVDRYSRSERPHSGKLTAGLGKPIRPYQLIGNAELLDDTGHSAENSEEPRAPDPGLTIVVAIRKLQPQFGNYGATAKNLCRHLAI